MAKLLFLGRLEDLAGAGEREVALDGPTPLDEVLAALPADLREALRGPRVKIARNGDVVPATGLVVVQGDEIAFLPPVSGG